MKFHYYLFLCLFPVLSINNTYAQHDQDANGRSLKLQFAPVLSTFLSDPELKNFQFESRLLTVPPSLIDTVAHRHDADLFGYVIEGSVEIGLEYKDPITFKTGQMFHEKRNVVHSLTRNPDKNTPAKVLLISIIKEGRQKYTRVHPER